MQQEAKGYTDWTAEEWRSWWESLESLRRRDSIGPASREAFAWIWMQCGAKVRDHFRFYLPHLAAAFRKSVRNAQYWLDYLQRKELLFVRNRTLKARVPEGWVVIDIYHPNPELRDRPIRVDPQRWLPGMEDGREAPPIVAQCPPLRAQSLPVNSARSLPVNSAQSLPKLYATPCKDAIMEAVRSGQVSMRQAFTMLTEPRGPPPQVAKKLPAHDIRYQKSRNLNLDIVDPTQEAFEKRIHQALGDPDLHSAPARKLAKKLAGGELEWDEVQRMIEKSRQVFRDGKTAAPWIYFVGAAQRAFEERSWRWRTRKGR